MDIKRPKNTSESPVRRSNLAQPRNSFRRSHESPLEKVASNSPSAPVQAFDDIDVNTLMPIDKPIPTQAPQAATSNKKSRLVFTKKVAFLAAIVATGIGIASVGIIASMNGISKTSATTNTSGNISDSPAYETLLPAGKSIEQLGGWQRISPPDKDPVYAYADSIDGVSISVSQQPAPKPSASSSEDQVTELAKKFNASTKIYIDDIVLHIGTSAKGPQSALMAKNDVLVMIKSQQKISNQAWENYARSLR